MISEFTISCFNEEIVGTFFESESTYKLVIFACGFGQARNESDYFFSEMCKKLQYEEIDSFIFDYVGVGESSGKFEKTSLEEMQSGFKSVLDYFLDHYNNRYQEIYFIGSGIGCTVINRVLQNYCCKKFLYIIDICPFFSYSDIKKSFLYR